MHLTLLIPELVWSNPDDRSVFDVLDGSALASLVSRIPPSQVPQQAGEDWLARRCGFPAPPPLAALRCAGAGIGDADADWICADPVHLRFHQERLILADASQLALSADESAALLQSLNDSFGDIGRFVSTTTEQWALRLVQPVARAWPPLSQTVGREVRHEIMLDDPVLKRLGNEVQMLLHAHPVNRTREEQGRMTVNALWFWGAGRLVAPPASQDLALFSTTAVAQGIARSAGIPLAPPQTLATLLAGASRPQLLVELDALLHPASFEDSARYLDLWREIDRDWFAGIGPALRAGRLSRVDLVAPTAFGLLGWSLARLDAWKFWGRRATLSARIQALIAAKRE